MRVFIVSTRGDSSLIARKLLVEGHDASMYVRDKNFRRYIEPDIPIVKSPTVESVSSDLLLVEDHEAGRFADKARSLNRLVVGGGTAVDKFVSDQEFNERSLFGCGFSIADDKTEGMVVEVGGWFDGEKYLRPHFLGFKSYRLGTGDVGPYTVGTGIVGKYLVKSRLFNDILRKTETLMKSAHYIGYAGVEGYINNDSFKAVRLQARLQFPVVNALGELHPSWSSFLVKLAKQQAEVVAVQPDKVVVGVTVLLRGYFDSNGQEPYRICCAAGQNVEEAKSKAYKMVTKMNIPHGYYRIDIGDNFVPNLQKLKEGDWL